jgi:hypothetical protein
VMSHIVVGPCPRNGCKTASGDAKT